MRTDSVRIADTALSEIRDLIARDYGQEYLPAKPNVYRSKKQAQEAHEAIRPSSVNRKPSDIESFLTPEQMKLYSLIWEQAVSSQMLPAQIVQTSVEIENGDYIFKATGSRIEFQGCLAVHKQDEDDESVLPELVLSSILPLMELSKHQHFTKPPARFTDASLVKVLEENGIGRPSTYAPTIATLTYRDYVVREGGSLVPTELGILVADLLVAHFQKLFDYEFTANMEEDLDKIEEENVPWVQIIRQFYSLLEPQVQKASEQMVSVKQESEKTNEVCEKCSKPMVIKWGRRGRFMSCSGWPECQNAKSLPTGVACPSCKEGFLVQRRARTGRGRLFYGCSKYPQCTFIANRLPKDGVFPKDGEPASGDGVDHESSEA